MELTSLEQFLIITLFGAVGAIIHFRRKYQWMIGQLDEEHARAEAVIEVLHRAGVAATRAARKEHTAKELLAVKVEVLTKELHTMRAARSAQEDEFIPAQQAASAERASGIANQRRQGPWDM